MYNQYSAEIGRTLQKQYEMDEYVHTLAEIAAELGMTPERVRQIQLSALYKLRAGLQDRGFTLADLLPPFERDDCPIEVPNASGLGRYS